MARPKKIKFEQREVSDKDQLKKRWTDLDEGLVRVVGELLADRGVSQASFGRRIGFSQPNINRAFHPGKDSHWSIPLLLATADYLGIPLWELIRAAMDGESVSKLSLLLAKTPPHTMDRLELIIREAAPKGTSEEVLNMLYNAQMFIIAAPDYVRRYADGELTDEEVYATLKEAMDSAPDDGNIWTQIHEMLNPEGKGPFSHA